MSYLKSFSTGQDYHKEEDDLTIGWRVACIADKEQVEKLLAPPPMMPTLDPVHELEMFLDALASLKTMLDIQWVSR